MTTNNDNQAVFVNLSNHPFSKWSYEQMTAALEIAPVVFDEPFPNIDPSMSKGEVLTLAYTLLQDILEKYHGRDVHVLVQGEMTFVYWFVWQCDQEWTEGLRFVRCYAATSERIKEEVSAGNFKMSFQFNQFRPYF